MPTLPSDDDAIGWYKVFAVSYDHISNDFLSDVLQKQIQAHITLIDSIMLNLSACSSNETTFQLLFPSATLSASDGDSNYTCWMSRRKKNFSHHMRGKKLIHTRHDLFKLEIRVKHIRSFLVDDTQRINDYHVLRYIN